jgi:lipopolysaccharide heptosyltransferase II
MKDFKSPLPGFQRGLPFPMGNKIDHNSTDRILIIRLGAMGDVLLTTPLLRILNKQYPEKPIDFLVKEQYAPLVETNPCVQTVLPFSPERGLCEIRRLVKKIRETRYETALDLQVNLRSWLFRHCSGAGRQIHYHPGRWRRFLLVHFRIDRSVIQSPIPLRFIESVSSLGIEDDGGGLDLTIDPSARESVWSALKKEGLRKIDKLMVLAPGAGRNTKRWPAYRFAEVGDYFQKQGLRVCLVGGKGDQEVCDRIVRDMHIPAMNFSNRFSLQETAAVIAESCLLVTNDTGVMHIGCALKKPVVALFGPTTHHLGFTPFRTHAKVVERDLDCRPCSYHGTERCPKGHFHCMVDISSAQVIEAAEELLTKDY